MGGLEVVDDRFAGLADRALAGREADERGHSVCVGGSGGAGLGARGVEAGGDRTTLSIVARGGNHTRT